jgi:hypothetical protein
MNRKELLLVAFLTFVFLFVVCFIPLLFLQVIVALGIALEIVRYLRKVKNET